MSNLRGFKGIEYNHEHWKNRRSQGEKVYLLALPSVPAKELPPGIQAYLRHGELEEVPNRYKCRVRQFWHAVPHVRIADAFLSYMSGEQPLLVTNVANLVAPNTLHVLRFADSHHPSFYAASWRTSLTRLSCELEGHALGGGLFKLEPSEAENVLVVRPRAALFKSLVRQFNENGRGSTEQFSDVADRYVLRGHLGLSQAECVLLRDSAKRIETWRKHN